jgi:hypothetical protein
VELSALPEYVQLLGFWIILRMEVSGWMVA